MRNRLQNLLIFLALCLCGLAAFQWHREAGLRRDLGLANQQLRDKAETILNLQKSLQTAGDEVKRLGSLRSTYTAVAESNRVEIAALEKQLETAKRDIDTSAKQMEAFRTALDQANDNIKRQNESLRKLADERNEAVVKFNELVAKYNRLVEQWNVRPAADTNGTPKQ